MPVILHSPVEGKQIGETYTGPNEQYHVENGNAKWADDEPFDGVFTGVAYDHSEDPEVPDYTATSSTDGYVPPIDEALVVNGDEPVRDYEPNVYGPANGTPDGPLPEVSDPWVNPHADDAS